ncbi:MAG TPA: alpha/beta hydrolase [Burkholderiales bacterium]|nr:alpha/beta hydrolase [Burkholderiales bacterium]
MPLDPQAELVVRLVKDSGAPELWRLTPDQARAQYLVRVQRLEVKESVYRTQDRRIAGPGRDIALRVCWPREARPGELFPVLLWFHGGGFVIGNLDTHDSVCRVLAAQADCVVVAVDYRLAPEFRFPAAVEDCHAALRWLALHGSEIGADPQRIAVGGDSAGGNLAAVMAILARNDGFPRLAFQLLIYPCTAPEPETPSHRQFADGYVLTRDGIVWFYKQYLSSAKDRNDFRFAPLVADDLSNLPPALVLVAGYDPLRDEGVDYARRLIDAGNRVTLSNYEGMIHGFYLMGGAVDAAKRAVVQSAQALKEAFGGEEVKR